MITSETWTNIQTSSQKDLGISASTVPFVGVYRRIGNYRRPRVGHHHRVSGGSLSASKLTGTSPVVAASCWFSGRTRSRRPHRKAAGVFY